MARRQVDHLLVGGGLAAANCARWLREEGGEARSCSWARVRPALQPAAADEGLPPGQGVARGRALSPRRVVERAGHRAAHAHERDEARPGERVATLSTKEEIEFDNALLATGANVRRLRVDGGELEGIHYIRAFGNSDAIRAEAEQARARGDHRRQLHRHRGGRLAHRRPRQQVHDRDARGRDARALSSVPRSAASSRACSRTTGWTSTAATSSSASRAPTAA